MMLPGNDAAQPTRRPWWRWVVYWGLPLLLLGWIAQHLDLTRLLGLAGQISPWVLAAALALGLVRISAGALRWFGLARVYRCGGVSLPRSAAEYWASLALGIVMPGTLGSDGFRVMRGGRRTGRYVAAACAVVVEKLVAVVSCALLIGLTLPWLSPTQLPVPVLQALQSLALIVGLGALLVALVVAGVRAARRRPELLLRPGLSRLGHALGLRITGGVKSRIQGLLGQEARQQMAEQMATQPLVLLRRSLQPRVWLPAVGCSLAIHTAAALTAHLLLLDLRVSQPFSASLFVAPLVIVMTSLPITVAGLGVREAVFVVGYGAVGVPAEAAVLVSFGVMASSLSVQAMGAALVGVNTGAAACTPADHSRWPPSGALACDQATAQKFST